MSYRFIMGVKQGEHPTTQRLIGILWKNHRPDGRNGCSLKDKINKSWNKRTIENKQMNDNYTKKMLTIIAICTLFVALTWGGMFSFISHQIFKLLCGRAKELRHSQKTPPKTRRWTASIWKNHQAARINDWHLKETRINKVICNILIMQCFYTFLKIHFMIVCKQITFLTHFIFPV